MFQQRPKTGEVYLHQTTFYHQDYQELQKLLFHALIQNDIYIQSILKKGQNDDLI